MYLCILHMLVQSHFFSKKEGGWTIFPGIVIQKSGDEVIMQLGQGFP